MVQKSYFFEPCGCLHIVNVVSKIEDILLVLLNVFIGILVTMHPKVLCTVKPIGLFASLPTAQFFYQQPQFPIHLQTAQ